MWSWADCLRIKDSGPRSRRLFFHLFGSRTRDGPFSMSDLPTPGLGDDVGGLVGPTEWPPAEPVGPLPAPLPPATVTPFLGEPDVSIIVPFSFHSIFSTAAPVLLAVRILPGQVLPDIFI